VLEKVNIADNQMNLEDNEEGKELITLIAEVLATNQNIGFYDFRYNLMLDECKCFISSFRRLEDYY
jgi:hypothetical protein